MTEELINGYVDRNGVKGDTEFILAALREVYSEFKKLETIKVDLKGAAGLSNMGPLFSQAKAGADGLAVATETVTQRIAQMNGKSKEFTDVLLKQTKAQEAAAKAGLLEAKAATERTKAKQNETKATEQSARAKEREKKLLDEATNDYLQLSRAYNEASLKAKNYVLRLGEAHPISVQAVKDANDLGNILKKLDASVGQNQRNVGNYASAYNGLGMSFAQVSRELPSLSISFQQFALAVSNNLPMVADELKKAKTEIANLKAEGKDAPSLFSRIGSSLFSWQVGLSVGITLLTVYAKQIGNFFSSMFSGSSAVNKVRNEQEMFNEAIRESGRLTLKNSIVDVTKLELYRDILNDTTRSQRERNQALNAYNSIADEANQLDASQLNNITLVNDKISTQIGLIEKRALSRAAESLLSEKAEALLLAKEEARVKAQKQMTNDEKITAQQMQGYTNKNAINTEAAINMQRQLTEARLISKDQAVINAQAEFDAYKKSLYGQIELAGFTAEEIRSSKDKSAEEAAKKAKEEADKRIQIAAELRKIEIQQDIDFSKQQSENEELSLVERLEALQKYYQARRALIDVTANTERAIGTKTAEELTLIEAQAADERIRLDREVYGQRDAIIKEFSKNFTDQEKKMQDGLAKIAEDGFKRFAKLEEGRLKLAEETSKKIRENQEKEDELRKKLQLQLAQEITTLTFTVATAGIEREKNQLQEQINLLEEKKKKDIEVANQTITIAQDRAAAISTIEARAQAQKEELQRRQRELDVKKAQFDRAQTIARIVQETAQNIVKYFGTPLALLAGAIGAVQIATVLAQPIPKYKHGKKAGDNYEGPAVVGDGGKQEAIIREDGRVEITSDRPQLTYVKSRDVVLPDASKLIDYVLAGNMGGRLATHPGATDNNLKNEINEMRKDIVQAIKSKKELHLKAGESGLAAIWKHGANQISYVNENTNWQ